MKSAKTYIPCVLVTIITVFAILGTSVCAVTKKVILNYQTCFNLIDEKELPSTIENIIEKYFEGKESSTGIPSETYMKSVTENWIDTAVKNNVKSGFDYLNGNTDEFSVEIDFTELDSSIIEFFSNYADENGYIKDSSYDAKLQSEIEKAHSVISDYTDIFKMNTLYNQGVLKQAKRYISYLDKITYMCIGLLAICLILIAVISLKNISEFLYWSGSAITVSAVIGLIPCVYITSTNYFDSFVIKQEQIFTAFTSFMYQIVNSFTALEIGLTALGVLMLTIYAVLLKVKTKCD